MSEIYADIADLSGVRVSLYFPGDRAKADRVINNLFMVAGNQEISGAVQTAFLQQTFFRLLGHPIYRASMKEDSLDKSRIKYAPVRLKIQVASVLMHAWSEVEHDLVSEAASGHPFR